MRHKHLEDRRQHRRGGLSAFTVAFDCPGPQAPSPQEQPHPLHPVSSPTSTYAPSPPESGADAARLVRSAAYTLSPARARLAPGHH